MEYSGLEGTHRDQPQISQQTPQSKSETEGDPISATILLIVEKFMAGDKNSRNPRGRVIFALNLDGNIQKLVKSWHFPAQK